MSLGQSWNNQHKILNLKMKRTRKLCMISLMKKKKAWLTQLHKTTFKNGLKIKLLKVKRQKLRKSQRLSKPQLRLRS